MEIVYRVKVESVDLHDDDITSRFLRYSHWWCSGEQALCVCVCVCVCGWVGVLFKYVLLYTQQNSLTCHFLGYSHWWCNGEVCVCVWCVWVCAGVVVWGWVFCLYVYIQNYN